VAGAVIVHLGLLVSVCLLYMLSLSLLLAITVVTLVWDHVRPRA